MCLLEIWPPRPPNILNLAPHPNILNLSTPMFYPHLIPMKDTYTKGDNLRHSSDVVKRVVSGHLDLNKLKVLQYYSVANIATAKYVVHVVPIDVLDSILTELPTQYLLNLQTLHHSDLYRLCLIHIYLRCPHQKIVVRCLIISQLFKSNVLHI